MRDYIQEDILGDMDKITGSAINYIKSYLKSVGGYLDVEDSEKDTMWAIYFDEATNENVEKEIVALKLMDDPDDGEVGTSLAILFKYGNPATDWIELFGGNFWVLPTVQSILEAIHEYK